MSGAAENGEDVARQVSDPEEYNQTARLRAINESRQRVSDTIEQSMARQVTDEGFGLADRQQVIRAAMYSYLTNIEWLMVDAEELQLLKQQDLGDVVIDPPTQFIELTSGVEQGYPRVIGSATVEPHRRKIQGIQGYLAAPEVFEATWKLQIQERHSEPQPVTETKQTHMPVHVSKNAFRVANQFLQRAGIDVDLAEEQHRAVVDDDVLEEVEKWRSQNVE
jgi:hypothetical protein